MVWAYLKVKLRQKCENDFGIMLRRVPDFLSMKFQLLLYDELKDTVSDLCQVIEWGFESPLLDFAMKRYSLHHRIPTS